MVQGSQFLILKSLNRKSYRLSMIVNNHNLYSGTGHNGGLTVTAVIFVILRVSEKAEIQNPVIVGSLPAQVLVIAFFIP